jgi:predicted branched-subunit amino acid permease
VHEPEASHSLADDPWPIFRQGVREMLPAAPAMAGWGLVTGVAMAKSALTTTQAVGLSLIGYAGAAQLAALPLMLAGAPVLVSILTAWMVNLRFVIYSAAVRSSFRSLSFWPRLCIGYLLSDLAFVLYMRHEDYWRESPFRGAYFLGLSVGVYVSWHLGSLIGIVAANRIPDDWGIGFVGTLALVALLVPMWSAGRAPLVGGLVASALGVICRDWPLKSGLVVAILAGVVCAVLVEPRVDARLRDAVR